MKRPAWEFLTTVESDDKPGKFYPIERRADGALRCGCESFRFRRGEIGSAQKTCKHLDVYRAAGAEGPVDGEQIFRQHLAQPAAPRRGAKVAGETFTFRRSFAFDGAIPGGRP